MSSVITETAAHDASVIGPDDGDPLVAAAWRIGFGNLANRGKYMIEKGVDIKTLRYTGAGTDHTGGTAFKNVIQDGTAIALTFTDVKVGDILLLHAYVIMDASTGFASDLRFGNTVGPITTTIQRSAPAAAIVDFWSNYTVATAGATLNMYLQVDPNGASEVTFDTPIELLGIHIRRS